MRIFCNIISSYRKSEEMGLALKWFRKVLPSDSFFHLLESDSEEQGTGLMVTAVRKALNEPSIGDRDELFLVARNPAFVFGPKALFRMRRILDRESDIDCVLPSDQFGFLPGVPLNFCSLYGLEAFTEKLSNSTENFIEYDGRIARLFLIRRSALERYGVPDDLFDLPARMGRRCVISRKAYVHILPEYYEQPRSEMIGMVPQHVRSLLDIGCAQGLFGHHLKTERTCRVVGMELNPIEARRARDRLDRVLTGDALKLEPEETFDCVTCLDSLEHFPNPERLLKRISCEFLNPGGYFLASIPNVGHWSILEMLLAGRWDYTPTGPLCNTHLRFFTLHSFTDLLKENGLTPIRWEKMVLPPSSELGEHLERMASHGMTVKMDSLSTLQYYILARKTGTAPP